jgi:hypothetical protein
MSSGESHPSSRLTTIVAAVAAIAALIGVFVQPTISPADLCNWALQRDKVTLTDPKSAVSHTDTAIGTAKTAPGHDLYILVRSPAELKYYIATPEPVHIERNGDRKASITVGSANAIARHKKDVGHFYEIIAVIVDRQGALEIGQVLAARPDNPFMVRVPHAVKETSRELPLRD